MLFFKKKKSGIIYFLDEVDDALNLAYFRKDVSAVAGYMTHSLLDYIVEEIHTHEDLTAGLGLSKYRVREWNIIKDDGTNIVAEKTITHKDVKIKGQISIPIGDNKKERWFIERVRSNLIVTDIKALEVSGYGLS